MDSIESTVYVANADILRRRSVALFEELTMNKELVRAVWKAVDERTQFPDRDKAMFMLMLATCVRPPPMVHFSELGERLLKGYQRPDQLVDMFASRLKILSFVATRDQSDEMWRNSDILNDIALVDDAGWRVLLHKWQRDAPAHAQSTSRRTSTPSYLEYNYNGTVYNINDDILAMPDPLVSSKWIDAPDNIKRDIVNIKTYYTYVTPDERTPPTDSANAGCEEEECRYSYVNDDPLIDALVKYIR